MECKKGRCSKEKQRIPGVSGADEPGGPAEIEYRLDNSMGRKGKNSQGKQKVSDVSGAEGPCGPAEIELRLDLSMG